MKQLMIDDHSLDIYLRKIAGFHINSRLEEQKIAARSRQGDPRARDKLITSNLKFVVMIAKEYQGRGVGLADLISEGNLALIKAAARYDERRGFKFISYAVWWIRQSILKAIAEQAGAVKRPSNHIQLKAKTSQALNKLSQKLGRLPTDRDIAKAIGHSAKEIQQAQADFAKDMSLDEVFGDDEDSRWIDLIEDLSPSPAKLALIKALHLEIDWALSTLTKREAEIIIMLHGLNGDEPKTLEKVGESIGLTRERTRQIKEIALAKLRHKTRSKRLSAFNTIFEDL